MYVSGGKFKDRSCNVKGNGGEDDGVKVEF